MQPVGIFPWTSGEVNASARPLVWLRSWRIVIRSPSGTPATHLEMWSSRATFPSPTSCRTRLAVNVLVRLATLNCMSVRSGAPGARSATPVAPTKFPFGLQMPTRTPGVRFVSLNRRTICLTLASVGASRAAPSPTPPFDTAVPARGDWAGRPRQDSDQDQGTERASSVPAHGSTAPACRSPRSPASEKSGPFAGVTGGAEAGIRVTPIGVANDPGEADAGPSPRGARCPGPQPLAGSVADHGATQHASSRQTEDDHPRPAPHPPQAPRALQSFCSGS